MFLTAEDTGILPMAVNFTFFVAYIEMYATFVFLSPAAFSGECSADASWSDVSGLLAVVFAYAFISGPFDFLGGYILPKEYKKSATSFRSFIRAWFRGSVIHGVMLIAVGLTLINSARVGGFWFTFGAFTILIIVLFASQRF